MLEAKIGNLPKLGSGVERVKGGSSLILANRFVRCNLHKKRTFTRVGTKAERFLKLAFLM